MKRSNVIMLRCHHLVTLSSYPLYMLSRSFFPSTSLETGDPVPLVSRREMVPGALMLVLQPKDYHNMTHTVYHLWRPKEGFRLSLSLYRRRAGLCLRKLGPMHAATSPTFARMNVRSGLQQRGEPLG